MAKSQSAKRTEFLARLRKDVAKYGGQKDLAAAMGISAPYLSDVLNGRRDPGKSILRFYGLREESVYVKDEAAEASA